MSRPTIERLREVLDYNKTDGLLRWKVAPTGRHKVGDVAGSRSLRGYIFVMVDGHNMVAHRVAWAMVHGSWPEKQVDHIDENKSNNKWDNLREANNSENHQNRRTALKNSASGVLGVSWHKAAGKWQSQIKLNKQKRHLGLFDSVDAASKAYQDAKKVLHPFCPA